MIEPVRPEHIAQVVGKLRNERALSAEHIEQVISQSVVSCAGTKNGEVVIIFGVQVDYLLSDRAYMWMLSTALIEKHKIEFLRQARQWIAALPYRVINCMVYFQNNTSIQWLEWMGFVKIAQTQYLDWGQVYVMELVRWQ